MLAYQTEAGAIPECTGDGAGGRVVHKEKYAPLVRYLEALDPATRLVPLTFAQIEAIIGALLPLSVRATPGFWTSSATGERNWQRAGFSARRTSGAVTFTRLPRVDGGGACRR